jgi:hypothetical protein
MITPRIYLAVDNCFALKRWTRPTEWLKVIHDAGLRCVEASSDNEADPLYADPRYMRDWVREVRREAKRRKMLISTCYSGHGTYTTLGLGHTDRRNRDRMLNVWLKRLIANAGSLGAGVGFYCHAFSESTLQDPALYRAFESDLFDRLSIAAAWASRMGARSACVEQMYSPHQVPWTVAGARTLLERVYGLRKAPLYLTLDVGHMCGQRRFVRPTDAQIRAALGRYRHKGRIEGFWLGPLSAWRIFRKAACARASAQAAAIRAINAEMDRYPYLFAQPEDGDPYHWLRSLGAYGSIVHLQQTDGASSRHLAFTRANNASGIVDGRKVLRAILASYRAPEQPGMPPRLGEIYLTLELFSATADINVDILERLGDSVRYWRRFVPRDGMRLSELV